MKSKRFKANISVFTVYLIVFWFIGANDASAQETENFSADDPKSLKEIIAFENSIDSKNKGFYSFRPYFDDRFEDMIPNVKPKALIFKRKDDEFFPNLHTWYFFDSDSLVRGFYYNWGFYNPSFNPSQNRELLDEQKSRKKEYLAQYERVAQRLKQILGEPTKQAIPIKSKTALKKTSVWDQADCRTVLELHFDPRPKSLPGTEFTIGGESHVKIITFYK